MFFGTQKLKDEIETLTAKVSSQKIELNSFIEKDKNKDNEISKLVSQNNQLQNLIYDLNEKLKTANNNTEVQTSSTHLSESLQHLLTHENQNLKVGLLDIQANLAESTDLARENLNNTTFSHMKP